MRKCVEVSQSNVMGLQTSHRKTGHGAMRLIGEGPVVGINEWNQLINENMFEGAEIKAAATARRRRAPEPQLQARPLGPPALVRAAGRQRREHNYWPSR